MSEAVTPEAVREQLIKEERFAIRTEYGWKGTAWPPDYGAEEIAEALNADVENVKATLEEMDDVRFLTFPDNQNGELRVPYSVPTDSDLDMELAGTLVNIEFRSEGSRVNRGLWD